MKTFAELSGLQKLMAVLAVLVLFLLIEPLVGRLGERAANPYLFSAVDFDHVHAVNISKAGSTTRLVFEDGQWFVLADQSFSADQARIDDFISALKELQSIELASSNPDRQAVFEVDDTSGTQVQLWNDRDDPLIHFYVGKQARLSRHYFRMDGSDDVLLVSSNLDDFMSADAQLWRDRTLLIAEEDPIRRIALTSPQEERVIERQDDRWIIFDGVTLRDTEDLAMRTLLGHLDHLEAAGFVRSSVASQADFNNPDYRLGIRFKDDSLKTLSFVEIDDGARYLVKTDQSDLTYWVSPSFVDSIFGLAF